MQSAAPVREIRCTAFSDQKPGTAGLRKRVSVFQQPHYLETFVQAILDVVELPDQFTVVIGGDGRFYNAHAIVTIIRLAAANGAGRLVIGRNGLLSTPAASNLIRCEHADLGFLLTASHNPGGPNGDFGIKFNMASGGQAPEHLTDAVFARSQVTDRYKTADIDAPDLAHVGSTALAGMQVDVVDPVAAYADLQASLFDFAAIRRMLAGGTRLHFDALNAATGPYARHIFCELLGAPAASVVNAAPLEDFGGLHPDPNPAEVPHLVELAESPDAPDLIAASDGDGDRNMILGRGMLVSPGDSLAIMLANAGCVPGYAAGVPGVARSMPTSRAVDAVATALDIPCYETPTGWRFFSNLLDAGKIALCGEESFGTSSNHTGEKDGIWAVLFWLNMMASLNKPVDEIVREHWQQYGRCFFQRRDYFIPDAAQGQTLLTELAAATADLAGATAAGLQISAADVFSYIDPVDGSVSPNQGVRVFLENGGRLVYRLSGTGTAGATLRVYLDFTTHDPAEIALMPEQMLAGMGAAAAEIAAIERHTGLTQPTATV